LDRQLGNSHQRRSHQANHLNVAQVSILRPGLNFEDFRLEALGLAR